MGANARTARRAAVVGAGPTGWLFTVALLGGGMVSCSGANRTWHYPAGASYWMSLMHLPLRVAIKVPMVDLDRPIWLTLASTGS